jgi:hypothetical protein
MAAPTSSHEEDAVDELGGRAGEAELVEVPVDVEEAVTRAPDQPLYRERAREETHMVDSSHCARKSQSAIIRKGEDEKRSR